MIKKKKNIDYSDFLHKNDVHRLFEKWNSIITWRLVVGFRVGRSPYKRREV